MWKTIEEFPLYEISDTGCVRNKKTQRELALTIQPSGYVRVNLRKDNQSYSQYVHRLVAQAFVEGDHTLEVNHIDGNKQNNTATNLEWITHKRNMRHAHDELANQNYPAEKRIRVQWLNGETMEFANQALCAQYFNVDPTTIRDYIQHKLTKARQIQADFYYI